MKRIELLNELIKKNYNKIRKKYNLDKTEIDVRGLSGEDKFHNDLLLILEKFDPDENKTDKEQLEDLFRFLKKEKDNTVTPRQINKISIDFVIDDEDKDDE